MKKTLILLAGAAILFSGCAKQTETSVNDSAIKLFESWIRINHPTAQKTQLGSYVIESEDGDGAVINGQNFLRIDYTIRGLDGTISTTTDVKLKQQLGDYSKTSFYGPEIMDFTGSSLYVGMEEVMKGKHIGMHVKAAIPGWLITSEKYATEKEYQDKVTGNTSGVYDIKVIDAFDDVVKWEIDSLSRYISRNYGINPADSVKKGMYYFREKTTSRPDSTFAKDAKVYVKYIGRLLNGLVFDTNIADTAKFYGIYNSSSKYEPTLINWGEKYTDLTMTSSASSMITGFSYTLFQMKPYEKGRAIFYSGWGYGASGSGKAIPAYSPLIFDFELVDKE